VLLTICPWTGEEYGKLTVELHDLGKLRSAIHARLNKGAPLLIVFLRVLVSPK